MKISADGILGSAERLNKQRGLNKSAKKGGLNRSTDRVEIESRVDARLDSIQKDMREVQSSLTRSQVIRDGLTLLRDESNMENPEGIYEEYRYNNQKVLQDFIDEKGKLSSEIIEKKIIENDENIAAQTRKITELHVATENIYASDLGSDKKINSIDEIFNRQPAEQSSNMNDIASLNADKVMRLLR